jgi:hypothetical protein
MIQIKQLFHEAGIADVRPTDEALERMNLSRRRFTQICEGSNKSDITLTELHAIKAWIASVKEIDQNAIVI